VGDLEVSPRPFWIWKHIHVHEVHAHEMHAREVQINHKRPHCVICPDLSREVRVLALRDKRSLWLAAPVPRCFATIKVPFRPCPRPSLHSTLSFILSPPSRAHWWRPADWGGILSHQECYRHKAAVIPVTEARLVNTLTSRSRVISILGRYNQKCGVVENEYV
jgi:hypothetical protein